MAEMSQKKKVVANGMFKAEIDEFLRRELAEDGYSGVEVRKATRRFEIIISATRTQQVLGEKSRRIRELTSVVSKRFNCDDNTVEVCILSTFKFASSAIEAVRPVSRSRVLSI